MSDLICLHLTMSDFWIGVIIVAGSGVVSGVVAWVVLRLLFRRWDEEERAFNRIMYGEDEDE